MLKKIMFQGLFRPGKHLLDKLSFPKDPGVSLHPVLPVPPQPLYRFPSAHAAYQAAADQLGPPGSLR